MQGTTATTTESSGLPETFTEACKKDGYDPATIIPDLSCFPEKLRPAADAILKLLVVTDSIREGHVFDYNNRNEKKWSGWADMETEPNNPSGFRLYVARYGNASSGVGARLSLRSEAEVEHLWKHFEPLLRTWMKQ